MVSVIKQELSLVLERVHLIIRLSWDEIRARYSRSVIGPFWLVLATAISALGLGYVWSILFNQDKATFIPALCIGLVIWQFLSTCVIEAPTCFITSSAILKNTLNPLAIFPITLVLKNLMVFGHNLVIILVVFLLYPPEVNWNSLLLIPGLLLVIANLICMSFILAFLGARFRDLAPAIASIMTIVFFLSPVIYKPNQLGLQAHFMWFNPFTYLISLIRDPLTGHASPGFAYVVVVIGLAFQLLIVAYLLQKFRYRVLYWL